MSAPPGSRPPRRVPPATRYQAIQTGPGGFLYVDERESVVDTSPEQLWSVIEGIGGGNGWYSWRLGWWARGVLDRVFGGPGLRRGRRNPNDLSVGDPLDWWRGGGIEGGKPPPPRARVGAPGPGRAGGGGDTAGSD